MNSFKCLVVITDNCIHEYIIKYCIPLYVHMDSNACILCKIGVIFENINVSTGQYISIPCHSQTRTKHADLVTLET